VPLAGHTRRLAIQAELNGPSPAGAYILPNGYLLVKVKKVELEEQPGQPIYNLEVTEDNSYVVDAVAHNSNNNGDDFPGSSRPFRPFLDKSATEVMLDGGLEKYHNPTFMEFGGVFKNHANRHKQGAPSGYIVKAAINKDMARGELLVGLEEDKWRDELQKLAEDKPVYWSIAADVPYDICSACGNRATSFSKYCAHLRNDMLAINKEGHQVRAINDKPLFHDISGVFRPADKIAFALRKVASGKTLSSAELAELDGMTPRMDILQKYARQTPSGRLGLLLKLAAMEKEILSAPAGAPVHDLMLPFRCDGGGPGEFGDRATKLFGARDPGALFGALRDKLVVMPMETFLKVVMGGEYGQVSPLLPAAKGCLPGIFGRMAADPGIGKLLDDASYEPHAIARGQDLEDEVGRLVGSHSLAAAPVQARVIKIIITGVPKGADDGMPKSALEHSNAAADFIAREYARYVLSFAAGLPEDRLRLTVAQTLANSMA